MGKIVVETTGINCEDFDHLTKILKLTDLKDNPKS